MGSGFDLGRWLQWKQKWAYLRYTLEVEQKKIFGGILEMCEG